MSESSFNAWNREISLREREYAPTANAAAILSAKENPFVPIRLVPDSPAADLPPVRAAEPLPANAEGLVEISAPGGAVLRVRNGCGVEFVAQLFTAIKSETSSC